ncbi:MAG: DUF3792 family protein [Clostridia bacterium]
MNKVKKPNLIILTISNMLFCAILLLILALLSFNFNLDFNKLFSLLILLLTGIYSGFTTSKSASNKKLLYALISSTVFLLLYSSLIFWQNKQISFNQALLICALNIYFGTLIGTMMSLSKTKRKGRK